MQLKDLVAYQRERRGEDAQHDFKNQLKVGSKIYFESEKRPYTVKAVSDRYVICTKPFNLLHTVFYVIIDFDKLIRGPNDLVFNLYDYTIQQGIDNSLKDLVSGELEVSHRHCIPLDILRVDNSHIE